MLRGEAEAARETGLAWLLRGLSVCRAPGCRLAWQGGCTDRWAEVRVLLRGVWGLS